MAATTIRITGKVVKPDGTGVAGGVIEIRLLPPGGTTDDGGLDVIVAPNSRAKIDPTDGSVDFDLVPNDLISGEANVYRATYKPADQEGWVEFWTLASTDANPLDIGDIEKALLVGTGPTVVSRLQAGMLTGSVLPAPVGAFLGVVFLLDTGSGETATYVLLRDAGGTLDWVFAAASMAPERIYSTLPDAAGFPLFTMIIVDPGTGETTLYQLHRDGDDVEDWVVVASGGAAA